MRVNPLRHPLCALEQLRARVRGPLSPTAEDLRRHAAAEAAGKPTYLDVRTRREVRTASALGALGSCCGLGCRHCPWPADRAG